MTKCVGLGIKASKQQTEAFWCAIRESIAIYLKKDCPQADFQIVIFRKEIKKVKK